jgi:restriction endonuclease S subunit
MYVRSYKDERMNKGWRRLRFRECVTMLSGGTPSKAIKAYWVGDIPWVSCKDMKTERIFDALDHLNKDSVRNGTRLVALGTVLVVVRGMILAKEFPVAIAMREIAFNQDLKALKCAPFLTDRFLFYWLKSMTHEILGLADEAAHGTKRLQTDRLESLEVDIPPRDVQETITSVLSAYDDLIENNTRRIKILEQMAQMIYREWFVNFRFPGHEKVRIVDSEIGPIPQRWAVKSLKDVSALISRGISPTYNDAADGLVINQKCIRNGRLSLASARRQSKKVPEEKMVREGDVLINSTGVGTLGRAAQVLEPIGNCTVDSHVLLPTKTGHLS